ncbi:uncharacterized protein LOC101860484 [Aplysia californica]|uniref:Uncharacterized protein LOC101860484 n=1 Tax=Aplysia californica TaxID=6500 RepID=A0ABM0ZVE2_APLCA|nr:uncharacterized protein LOC101860484 [Aplysia californica]
MKMAGQPTKSFEEFLTCSICFDIFKHPKILPCVHTFCKKCLSDHIQSRPSSTNNGGFQCPQCRAFVAVANPKANLDQWAGQLPDNFAFRNMIEHMNPNANPEAAVCAEHGNKLELVCANCDTVPICYTCQAVSHRMCSQVYTVSVAAQERRNSISYHLSGIQERQEKVRVRLVELDKESKILEAHRNLAMGELQRMYEAAQKLIKDEFDKTVTEMHDKFTECKQVFDAEKSVMKTSEDQLQTFMADTQKMLHDSDMAVVSKCKGVVSQAEDVMSKNPATPEIPTFSLTLERNNSVMNKMANLNFGNLTVTRRVREIRFLLPKLEILRRESISSTATAPASSFRSTNGMAPPPSPILTETNLILQSRKCLPTKLRGDKTKCCLRDVTIVSGNVIVVTDGDNMTVKSFTTEGEHLETSCYKTDRTPCGITTVADMTVAVMIPKQKEMHLLFVRPNILLKRKVRLPKGYYVASALSPDRLAVCTCPSSDAPTVDVIDCQGQLLWNVPIGSHLLANPMYMCTTPSRDILVSDPTISTCVCFRQNGVVLFNYSPDVSTGLAIKKPFGISVDKQGVILVADKDTNSVIAMSAEGRPTRQVITRSNTKELNLKSVAVGERGMIVTMHEDKLNVFKVQNAPQ